MMCSPTLTTPSPRPSGKQLSMMLQTLEQHPPSPTSSSSGEDEDSRSSTPAPSPRQEHHGKHKFNQRTKSWHISGATYSCAIFTQQAGQHQHPASGRKPGGNLCRENLGVGSATEDPTVFLWREGDSPNGCLWNVPGLDSGYMEQEC